MTTVLAFPLADTWGMHDGVGTGWGIVMLIGMFLFWGAIVVGIVWLIELPCRAGRRAAQRPVTGESTVTRESPVESLSGASRRARSPLRTTRRIKQILVQQDTEPKRAD